MQKEFFPRQFGGPVRSAPGRPARQVGQTAAPSCCPGHAKGARRSERYRDTGSNTLLGSNLQLALFTSPGLGICAPGAGNLDLFSVTVGSPAGGLLGKPASGSRLTPLGTPRRPLPRLIA